MSKHRQLLGREGEERAARYLEARGYQIVARNVRADRVEIDLVARNPRHLVFVEVKARRQGADHGFGSHRAAAEAVDARKQARLRRGALAWRAAQPAGGIRRLSMRFDVITCLDRGAGNDTTAHPEDARWSIEHWVGAF